ncbi:MAG TPA: hypothetical protein VMG59_05965 [Phycisphaerae bacterium]|nr:hypothetical protein [Phycisphaerae bacterium]
MVAGNVCNIVWHLIDSTVGISVVSALVASLVILFIQRLLVWSESGKICGKWGAYEFDKKDGQKLLPMVGAEQTNIGRAGGFFSLFNPFKQPNVLNVRGSDSNGRQHVGEIILDTNYCHHGLRTVNYQSPKNDYLELAVQEIWVIDGNIHITPIGPNSASYGIHVLKPVK